MHRLQKLFTAYMAKVNFLNELEHRMVAYREASKGLVVARLHGHGNTKFGKGPEGTREVDVEEHTTEVEEYVFERVHCGELLKSEDDGEVEPIALAFCLEQRQGAHHTDGLGIAGLASEIAGL